MLAPNFELKMFNPMCVMNVEADTPVLNTCKHTCTVNNNHQVRRPRGGSLICNSNWNLSRAPLLKIHPAIKGTLVLYQVRIILGECVYKYFFFFYASYTLYSDRTRSILTLQHLLLKKKNTVFFLLRYPCLFIYYCRFFFPLLFTPKSYFSSTRSIITTTTSTKKKKDQKSR